MEIAGVFIFNGKPRNGAIAKLWQATGLGSPPSLDTSEPDGGYQQGSNVTTGIEHGCDGAFRFEDIPTGEYYISVEYDGKRAWLYAGIVDIHTILTTQGDILIRGASGLERKAKGNENAKLRIVDGVITWT